MTEARFVFQTIKIYVVFWACAAMALALSPYYATRKENQLDLP